MESITRRDARERILAIKESGSTEFFNRGISLKDFSDKLEVAGFSTSEITLIVSALRLVGAKFKKGE